MAKIIMMRGLPASGKTTKAKEMVQQYGNYVRLNRDLLREMLHFNKWSGNNEDLTRKGQAQLARFYLQSGINIIVDDTNLSERHRTRWATIAAECSAKFEVHDMGTDMVTCLMRNAVRTKRVPEEVIVNMALETGLYTPSKGFILCDLDGTICDITHRLHHVKQEKKDWKSFFAAIPEDKIRREVAEQLDTLVNDGYELIYVSARPDAYIEETRTWLQDNDAPAWQTIIMRRSVDKRPDVDVKRDMLNKFFPNRKHIHKIFDDRPSVIRMWKEEGLDVVDVGKGVEF